MGILLRYFFSLKMNILSLHYILKAYKEVNLPIMRIKLIRIIFRLKFCMQLKCTKKIFSNCVNIMEGHGFQQLSAVTDPPPVKVSINH